MKLQIKSNLMISNHHRNIKLYNLEFKGAVCNKIIHIFQNGFPFEYQGQLNFTQLVLLTKFIISQLLIYNSFRFNMF